MDRALYVAMSGATQTMRAQAVNNNNIANAGTVGFRAEIAALQAAPVNGPGEPTRVNALAADGGWDATSGALQPTGNPLDVALRDNAWLAVQGPDGKEAYTRAGDLRLNALGQLSNGAGHLVLSDGGAPLSVPPNASITIGGDGTVSIVPLGQGPATQATVARLKVVDAQPAQLQRGADGLMRATPGAKLQAASGNVLASGMLESSNVNLPQAMVSMIELARQFELQVKMMKTVEDNATASQSVMRMS
ncbi:MAG: flagellar basal body rod protein FlgF [Nevskiaceae bacterium]|nr:MAG: flagellar basal body rod protein FlgF [Nevskiaceae bacterium]